MASSLQTRFHLPIKTAAVVATVDSVPDQATATRLPAHQHHCVIRAALLAKDHAACVRDFEFRLQTT